MKYLFSILLSVLIFTSTSANKYFVDATKPDNSGNGTSWATAKKDLQDAIDLAVAGDSVLVAQGVYYPTELPDGIIVGDHRSKSFHLNTDIFLIGGFPAGGGDRDWEKYRTILSGDIGVPEDSTDNCYHVLISSNLSPSCVIDGFEITKGNATTNVSYWDGIAYSGSSFVKTRGGGMSHCNSSPTLSHIKVYQNTARNSGGGIYFINSNSSLSEIDIYDNHVFRFQTWRVLDIGGGGIFIDTGSVVNLKKVDISRNSCTAPLADSLVIYWQSVQFYGPWSHGWTSVPSGYSSLVGGGIFNKGVLNITDFTISNNSTVGGGGGVLNNGILSLKNGKFLGNSAGVGYGGGLHNWTLAILALDSVEFTSNEALVGNGGGVFSSGDVICNEVGFSHNKAAYGGGMGIHGNLLSLQDTTDLDDVMFYDNSAYSGGGLSCIGTNIKVSDAVFSNNRATTHGGGFWILGTLGGAHDFRDVIINNNSAASGAGGSFSSWLKFSLTNVVFAENNALNKGGALSMHSDTAYSWANGNLLSKAESALLTNVTLYDNTAGNANSGLEEALYRDPVYADSIHLLNSVVFLDTAISGLSDFGTIHSRLGTVSPLSSNPFKSVQHPLGPDGVWRTADDGLRPISGSPLIDEGQLSAIDSSVLYDVSGEARVYNDSVDIGAYEYTCTTHNDTITQIVTCHEYVSPSGRVFKYSGRQVDTLTNSYGCDSIFTFDLRNQSISTSITQSGEDLKASGDNSLNYYWIDCGNNNQRVQGANSSTFTPSQNGSYAVVVSNNYCSDTSSCYLINDVSIDNHDYQGNIKCYPNPSSGLITVAFPVNSGLANIKIFNLHGQMIRSYSDIETSHDFEIALSPPPGVYELVVEINGVISSLAVVFK